ncbi:MAG: hypothetical protein KGN84_02570 [Acidobacteriota bacterium]|nr:hypothetical protein [Acidobacteriota bacterium]
MSRRELAPAAMAAAFAPAAQSQTPQAELAKTVKDAQRRNAETMAKVEVPVATEPAFQFKA